MNSTVAGTRFFGLYIAFRRSSRSSGTFEMPIDASARPWAARPESFALVMRSKSVVLPVEPKPMSAALSIGESRVPNLAS